MMNLLKKLIRSEEGAVNTVEIILWCLGACVVAGAGYQAVMPKVTSGAGKIPL